MSTVKFALFGLAFTLVFVLLNVYIYRQLINKLNFSDKTKTFFRVFLLINFFGIVLYMVVRRSFDVSNVVYFLLSVPIGIIFLLFCITLIYNILNSVLIRLPISQQRRDFFKKSLDITSLGAAVALNGKAMYNAKHIEVQTVDVKLKDLKQSYLIVQLSDVHIGGLVDATFIKNLVTKVNALKPDLVAITGDLVDVKLEFALPALKELTKLNSTYGTYFCVGNHEYFHGLEAIIKTVKSLGITVLENENLYIGEKGKGFNLAGVYDIFGYRINQYEPDLVEALKGKDKHSPSILLAHQPRFIDEVFGVDLMLSGHTHGGQIYPFKYLVKLAQPYISGLHQHDKRLQIYVNKGTGFWGPPMRLGSDSEITLLKLS
jgi:predicted MPP superfamily phosphohydrolase